MKTTLIITLLFLLMQATNGQNLVPNSSFAIFSQCPDAFVQFNRTANWFNPSNGWGTPDYFNACDTTNYVGIPQNLLGYQNARTDSAYAGIIAFWKTQTDYREYIEVKLTDSLKAGKKYCVQFYVSLADSVNYATDDIGAYISKDSIFSNNSFALPFIPHITNLSGSFLVDKTNWILISGIYTAQGGEKFLTIGNFKDELNTDTTKVGNSNSPEAVYAYYYIDDVLVMLCDSVNGIGDINGENPINIYSAGSKIIVIETNKHINDISVFNILGQKIFSEIEINSPFTINLFGESQGIYVIQTKISNKFIIKKIFLVQ